MSTSATSPHEVPVKEIPGTYGLPLVGAIVDRIQYFRGVDNFFKRRVEKYQSTVFRVNMPPGPPFFPYNRVIILLDGKSFPVLYDLSKVDKKNNLAGTYIPSLKFTGGYRATIFMDPSEEKHHRLKSWLFELLRSNREKQFTLFAEEFDKLSAAMEKELANSGKASFTDPMDQLLCNFLCRYIAGADPVAPGPASLGTDGPSCMKNWLAALLAPTVSSGVLPKFLDELTIHLFPLPFCLVSTYYHKLYNFLWTNAILALDVAENQFGLNREEACNNLVFYISFNAFGGLRVFFTNMVEYVARAGVELHRDLAEEVRAAVEAHGGLTGRALESMALVRSTAYEVLRIDPPVPLQYGRAKKDFFVESHDGRYAVKKGEMLCGYQPFATRDPEVFTRAEEFVPRRFMGEDGQKMLKHLLWSNGRETDETSADNKQCAGQRDVVVSMAHLFLAHFFLRYNSFAIAQSSSSSSSVTFTMLTKGSS